MSIEVQFVSKSYETQLALNEISFSAKKGEIIGFLGPNGAGKSTLIKAMARLLECQGEIRLQGRGIHSFSSEQLAQHLAYLPQHSQLQFPLEVEEVLSLATLPFSLTRLQQRQQVKQVIRDWGIESLVDKDFRQLSGGEQQRCQIARTYLQLSNMKAEGQGCGLWLLDEPASSLDLEHQQQLQKICLQAAQEGHCVVIVLHDLNQAFNLADEVWLLDKGQIRAQGKTADVMTEQMISDVFNVSAKRIDDADKSLFVFG